MRLEVGCRFVYDAQSDVPAVTVIEPHPSVGEALVAEWWEGGPSEPYEDVYRNRCRRIVLSPGSATFAYGATVEVSAEPEEMPGRSDVQHRIEQLPAHALHWLLPSRMCESDLLAGRAWELFGALPAGRDRVQAVCDWLHTQLTYGIATVPTTTAVESLAEGGGMCRDFAHLGVTFCRGLGIPARYVAGYLPDIGIPGPFPPMDFHAWFEVWLGARWWTFDARFNVPRIGRVPIAYGRDAVDVAMVTTYGPASLAQMTGLGGRSTRRSLGDGEASMIGDSLGELIATLGSIDDDEIDWPSVRQTTVLIHQTFRYTYPGPISDLRQRLMVVPPDFHGHQRLVTHKLRVSGCNLDSERSYDSFGNVVLDLSLDEVECDVEFSTWAVVERDAPADDPGYPDEIVNDRRYGQESHLTGYDDGLREAAGELSASGAEGLELAEQISRRFDSHFTYTWGVTSVETTAAEAWRLGQGVCQDYAHCMLALCRLCGLPARYVSGHLLGDGGTHAWVEVLVPGPGECAPWRTTRRTAGDCGIALHHRRSRSGLHRRSSHLGDVPGPVPGCPDHSQACSGDACRVSAAAAAPGDQAALTPPLQMSA